MGVIIACDDDLENSVSILECESATVHARKDRPLEKTDLSKMNY